MKTKGLQAVLLVMSLCSLFIQLGAMLKVDTMPSLHPFSCMLRIPSRSAPQLLSLYSPFPFPIHISLLHSAVDSGLNCSCSYQPPTCLPVSSHKRTKTTSESVNLILQHDAAQRKKGQHQKPDFGSDHAALRHGREVRFAEKGFECLALPAQEQVDRYVLRPHGRTKQADSKSRKDGPGFSNIYRAIVQSLGKIEPLFWMHTV
jgi:hypothetical protein